jgi:hypothetical protein
MEYQKNCTICGCAFIGKGPAARYCPVHLTEKQQEQKTKNRIASQKYKIAKGLVQKPGVGSGNNQQLGTEHRAYKHGWFIADRLRPQIKARRYCERCSKDLLDANRYMWVVHHRDHNHFNNMVDNLELLCKRCHQLEHECYKAYAKGATTRAKARTLK